MNLSARVAALFNRSGAARDNRADVAVMPVLAVNSAGSGALAHRRLRATFEILLLALLALAAVAAPASAAFPASEMGAISNVSYDSAQVEGKVNPNGGFAEYRFEYCPASADCNDNASWASGGGGFLSGSSTLTSVPPVTLTGLKGGTKYFVRIAANFFFQNPGYSDPPNPDFTTLPVDPPTIVATDEASEVFSTTAKATGRVKRPANANPAFDVTHCRFEYVTDADFGATGFAGASAADCAEISAENPLTGENAERDVSAQLTGLQPETTYHLRLVAENASPVTAAKEAANAFTTAPQVAPPTVIAANDATEVSYSTAKVSGIVERPAGADPALDINCHFEYIADVDFNANPAGEEFAGAGQADCAQNPITDASVGSDGKQAVSADLSGLRSKSGVTYHLRLVAENGGGTVFKVASNFTTLPGGESTSTIDSNPSVGYTSAELSGTVVPGVLDEVEPYVLYSFEYAEVATGIWSGYPDFKGQVSSTSGPKHVSGKITGLIPDTEYMFRLSVSGASTGYVPPANPAPGPYPSATTRHLESPSATLDPVTVFTGTTAHFSGMVDTNAPAGPLDDIAKAGYKTDWHFECTPACPGPGGEPYSGVVQGEEGSKAISVDATHLEANTTYEVRLVVHNELYSVEPPVQTFKTSLIKPTIKAAPGGSDGQGGFTLQGIINPNGSNVADCKFEWGPNSADYAFTADCSPMPGAGAKPVTVEAHLTGLNPGVVYHYNLLATNEAGTSDSGDQEFIPTLNSPEVCPNGELRKENNSLALPECRAYEMVTPPSKEGFDAEFIDYSEAGEDNVHYNSGAGSIANSGQAGTFNDYVATRSAAGWETIPNLNGASGSLYDAPSEFATGFGVDGSFPTYSADLQSSVWPARRHIGPPGENWYLRLADGTFTLIGDQLGAPPVHAGAMSQVLGGVSDDLSHVFVTANIDSGNALETPWGPGVYEYVGTDNIAPRRVDLDNAGDPVSECVRFVGPPEANKTIGNAGGHAISADGGTIVFTAYGGCGGDNPPADELWARVDGSASFEVSASRCSRPVGDPDGACNAPSKPTFAAVTPDGSRVFFTTTQQLLDGDTDQTNDLYACDIPTGGPAPIGKANSCSSLREISGASAGAEVELPVYLSTEIFEDDPGIASISKDGSAAYFVAKGVLADNKDALGEEAVAGDHNLYAWRQDASHPGGQTSFIGRLLNNDVQAQTTTDGHYLLFATASSLVDTDTDTARDVYRYDADTGEILRVSTAASGLGGNGDAYDADFSEPADHHPNTAISGDGQKIVFTTSEALSPLDGNGEPDAYLWTPSHVSLITTGSVGGGSFVKGGTGGLVSQPTISDSGRDVYFQTPGALTPADGDTMGDVYDARVGGGFRFAQATPCSGEACQSPVAPRPAAESFGTEKSREGNQAQPKACPKGKTRKHGKCVRKHKRHSGKKHHGKKAGHRQGGGK